MSPVVRPFIPFVRFLLTACSLGLAGCDDLGEFRTGAGQVFRGEVVGSDSAPGEPSFIRQGFASHTQMELTFDPDRAGVVAADGGVLFPSQGPGVMHTYTCEQGTATCRASERTAGPFDGVALQPIESLAHDVLSQYTFPGGARVRSYIFGARFASSHGASTHARYAMVFLSLMERGEIEVRVIAPSVLGSDGQEVLPALFGVFSLSRQAL